MAVKLPSARNVPTVDPGIARDPGLTVSTTAFGAATGQALTKVGEAGSDVAESIFKQQKDAQDKAQKRQDQIEAARVWSEIQEQDQEDFAETTATQDIGNRAVYEQLNERRIQRRQEAFDNWTGSPDGLANLTEDLVDLNSRYLGQALSAHTEAAITRNEQVVNKQASPLIFQAHKNPASIKQVIADLNGVARRNAAVFDAISEDELRAELHQRAAIAAIEGDLSRGRLGPAQTSLDAFVAQGLVNDEVALNAQRRIDQIRFAYDEAALKGQAAPDLVAVPDPNSATGFSYIQKTLGGPAPAPTSGQAGLSDVNSLRSQFMQASGDFVEVRDSYARIRETASAEASAAGDIALVMVDKVKMPAEVAEEQINTVRQQLRSDVANADFDFALATIKDSAEIQRNTSLLQ